MIQKDNIKIWIQAKRLKSFTDSNPYFIKMPIDVDAALTSRSFWAWRHKRYFNLLTQQFNINIKTNTFNTWKLAMFRMFRMDFQKLVFKRWRNLVQVKIEQKSISKADIFHQKVMKNSLNNIFHEWILFANKEKFLSQSLGDVREVANQDLLKNFIQRWAHKYHSAENIVSAIDHTSKFRIMKRIFSQWKIKFIGMQNAHLDYLNHKYGKSTL